MTISWGGMGTLWSRPVATVYVKPCRYTHEFMEKYEKIIVAAIVAVGLLMLGLCIKSGIDNFTNKDRRVTVKGLAEKEVDADKVTWTMSVQVAGDELKPLFSALNTKMDAIQQFLKEKGIKGKGE